MMPNLRQLVRTAACLLLATPLCFLPETARAAETSSYVLLHNGGVIAGRVTETLDQVFIAIDTGEIRLKRRDVRCVCTSLDEAYRYRRGDIQANDLEGTLDLVAWCIEQRLLGYAAENLQAAMSLNPRHARLPILERRLAHARGVSRASQPEAVDHAAEAEAAISNEPAIPSLERRIAEARQGVAPINIPPEAISDFTARIQPLLLNTCTAGGCHGPASNASLKLERVAGRSATRQATMANLSRVLGYVDADFPRNSQLLTAPSQPGHGRNGLTVFGPRNERAYLELENWILRATGFNEPPEEEMVSQKQKSNVRNPWQFDEMQAGGPGFSADQQMLDQQVSDAAYNAVEFAEFPEDFSLNDGWDADFGPHEPGLDSAPGRLDPDLELYPVEQLSPVKRGAEQRQWQPVDEFDPEIFNRRYHGPRTRTPSRP